jgi:ABC-type transport system involved in multi-copper enzyme maturation permease subunit
MTASALSGPRRRSAAADFGASVATIVAKELRSRMRGRRPFVVLTAYLGLLALVAYGIYVSVLPQAQAIGSGRIGDGTTVINASGLIGMAIFSVLSILQIILVAVIAPAFTAGQISLEREKQTLDLLMTTPLRPGAIVLGKLATALAFVVLLVVAAVPITAIVLMYGGARIENIAQQLAVLLATAFGFGAIGIFASALLQRTQAATVVAYCAVLVAILGTAMLFGFWQTVAQRTAPLGIVEGAGAPEVVRYVNPMVAMLDVVAAVEPAGGTPLTRPLYEQFGSDLGEGVNPSEPVMPGGFPAPSGDEPVGYWWPRITGTLVGLGVLLTFLAMRLVAPATRPSRWPWRRREDVA